MRIITSATVAHQEEKGGRILNTEDILMTAEVKCNQCSKSLWKASYSNHPPTPEYLTIFKNWGKHSKWDGQIHELHICQDCYTKLTSHFEIRDIMYDPR